ncbi:hypothetical protein [Streptomyces sp. NPDC002599]|uniref:hypothetical protein n=1 Tax=Streptomyces sp. NPDC002599 TaxID=3154421 RepID=UPI00332EC55B
MISRADDSDGGPQSAQPRLTGGPFGGGEALQGAVEAWADRLLTGAGRADAR